MAVKPGRESSDRCCVTSQFIFSESRGELLFLCEKLSEGDCCWIGSQELKSEVHRKSLGGFSLEELRLKIHFDSVALSLISSKQHLRI